MAIFDRDPWWQPHSAIYLLQTTINPVRIAYFRERLRGFPGGTALEVGCGGGFLCEEIAAMGFVTTGIDPSAAALQIAADHARAGGLPIRYLQGVGEELPFPDESFDAAFCCDVLEHVQDQAKTVAEIARILRPGGIFCYDTLNRTLLSRLVVIGILQKWKRWAVMPPELHDWHKFITPEELKMLLGNNHLCWREHRGVMPATSPIKTLSYLRRRARGEWNYKDLALRLQLVEGRSTQVMYMGYAVKEMMPLKSCRKGD
ncbi:bifunctional 2-polyprenyl-6-hydroxyphenol methylase/3-demethylubiquinol 3-O-methyltransferase UbiG [Geotalea sp. SG265]|uniref:bifunctional 2-polyprenyl-6-hydroxyphenol methylase/3-demethylubiquinol 3-O-methyltransferase UbiG n=1 Tax=Geotalea sp. SG265 TaxID=2922867 RepID=UPI001FAFFD61|nr:bifunctional 2-polyprenyl-6-hydroxyphenol methylase/3-demethylubiquinol 3-O-methyltransferase UbiG [Geotalea sp. SG265]